MAKISDESLKAAIELWKADDKEDVLDYVKTRMGGILTELQTLREIAKAAREFCHDCMGECSMCHLKDALAALKKGEHGDSLSSCGPM